MQFTTVTTEQWERMRDVLHSAEDFIRGGEDTDANYQRLQDAVKRVRLVVKN